jgi:F0F1-type ATP synthase, subunit a
LGLTPLNSNIAGNISVTAALAVLTLLITNLNGTKDYWQHIFAMPGVPKPLLLIIIPVELIGIFTKPFALTVRLFANIAAGHFMVLSLVSLIFIMSQGGKDVASAVSIAPLSIAFSVGIFFLELIVAAVQAYVFAMLTSVFIGLALEKHDDHH